MVALLELYADCRGRSLAVDCRINPKGDIIILQCGLFWEVLAGIVTHFRDTIFPSFIFFRLNIMVVIFSPNIPLEGFIYLNFYYCATLLPKKAKQY